MSALLLTRYVILKVGTLVTSYTIFSVNGYITCLYSELILKVICPFF
jgi:hypothetical protein